MKKFVVLILPIFLVFGFFSCTSGNVEKDEGAEAGVSSLDNAGGESEDSDGLIEGEGEEGDLLAEGGESGGVSSESPSEFSDSTDVGENMADDALAEDGFSDDGIASDSNGAGAEGGSLNADGETGPDLGAESSPDYSSTPEPGIVSDAGTANALTPETDNASSLPAEEPLYASGGSEESEPAPSVNIPLKKVAKTPYRKNGILINAIYIVRPGESLQKISEKIYGTDKSAELKKVNPHLSRAVKTGVKIYYNSPRRPDDESQILTFYEDNGVSPSIYTSQEGDNIRAVSKKLLGDDNSWKEIWATNADVESKGDLPAGIQLRYWGPDMVVESAALAANSQSGQGQLDTGIPQGGQPPMEGRQGGEIPPGSQGMGEGLPPPPPPPPSDSDMNHPGEFAQNDTELPPPGGAAGQLEPPPPPPPPPMPPPPSPPEDHEMAGVKEASGNGFDSIGEDPNQTMALGVGALLLLASVALFVIVRKKKRRQSLDFNTTTQTQID